MEARMAFSIALRFCRRAQRGGHGERGDEYLDQKCFPTLPMISKVGSWQQGSVTANAKRSSRLLYVLSVSMVWPGPWMQR